MEKRYQVFISSTFQDLKNARQEVSQALLRADCFPAGMELFPAADEEQFEFIKTIIDQSDYYILISAGRYGSIHPETGLSYTEMEYDYAVEIGKPVIRLLHRDPFNELKGEFIEPTDNGKKALNLFRSKMSQKKLVKYWSVPHELGTAVDHSLRHVIKTKPAIGGVRNDKDHNQNVATNSSAIDASAIAKEVTYAQLKTKMVPNRIKLGRSMHRQRTGQSCDLCRSDGYITIVEQNTKRELNCPKCSDNGWISKGVRSY